VRDALLAGEDGPGEPGGIGFNVGARTPVNVILKDCGIEFSEII